MDYIYIVIMIFLIVNLKKSYPIQKINIANVNGIDLSYGWGITAVSNVKIAENAN